MMPALMFTCHLCKGPKFHEFAPSCGNCMETWKAQQLARPSAMVIHYPFREKRPVTRIIHFPGVKNVLLVDFKTKRLIGRSA
jgi:hypothetical protein